MNAVVSVLALLASLLSAPAAPPAPGPGWYLTTISSDHGIRLVLLEPDGTRHQVLERDDRRWMLADWSTDGSTALLTRQLYDHWKVLVVDVATGDTRKVVLPDDVMNAVLAPSGDGLLTTTYDLELELYSLDGTRTPLATVSGPALASPDGSTLVTNGATWQRRVVRVLDAATGEVVRRVPVDGHCHPVRAWDEERVLMTCNETLALLDPNAGTVTKLTRRNTTRIGDYGHLDARRIDSGLYVEVAGACGYVFLGRYDHGRLTKVDTGDPNGNTYLLGQAGRRLVIEHVGSCDGEQPRTSITRFDPVTGRERVLLAPPGRRWLGAVLAYGERHPTAI